MYYVKPNVTSDDDKRNLVVIYLESGEATLANDRLFEKDAFAPLKEATQASDGWRSIDDFQQYEGGGWTMSGLRRDAVRRPLKGVGSARG
jgi:phosphoglycerol transferase